MPRQGKSSTADQAAAVRGEGRWLVATFRPVSLFSLRMTHATSKGGKTLLVPTPYAVKMALIDTCFRRFPALEALGRARQAFDLVKRREVRIQPPEHCVVQNTFVKILDAEREGDLPFKNTIAYREFVFYNGSLRIALAAGGLGQTEESMVRELFAHVNSLGKRGGFLQFEAVEMQEGELAVGFSVPITESEWRGVVNYGVVQSLDDFGEALCTDPDGFERISTYGSKPMKLNEHRVLTMTAIPYRRRSASRSFTWYERITAEAV